MLVAVAALAGLRMFQRELRRSALDVRAADAGIAGVAGGIAGAKLLWLAEHWGEEPLADLLLSRGGMSWFGGFAGGVFAGLLLLWRYRLPVVAVLAAATPALAAGHAIGRIGCFLVGDDYGRPSDVPWAVAFPEGYPPTTVPVHPTQVYEMALLFPLAWALVRWRREGWSDRSVLGVYLLATGAIRFAIEFVRVNERVAGPLTVAHLASLVVLGAGAVLLILDRRPRQPTQ